jgi:broad specificity phosphatase PhoE
MSRATHYLVRHGETVWNRERRFQGRHDSPLTELGVAQAERIGRALRRLATPVHEWTIVASPLGRAHRTASIIAEAIGREAAHIESDERLMELDLGCWEGLTFGEIDAMAPGTLHGCSPSEIFFRCPDGESYEDFAARVCGWANENAGRDRLIVVAHGLVSRMLRGTYGGLTREALLELAIPQDAIFRLTGGRIERLDLE